MDDGNRAAKGLFFLASPNSGFILDLTHRAWLSTLNRIAPRGPSIAASMTWRMVSEQDKGVHQGSTTTTERGTNVKNLHPFTPGLARLAKAVVVAATLLLLHACANAPGRSPATDGRTNGLVMLIEFEGIDGIRHWERELDRRKLTALVQVEDKVLARWPDDFRRLVEKGHVISGIHAETAFWDIPYQQQYRAMQQVQQSVLRATGRPMRVFGSRYFAYDANTLKAADALGIPYVLGRGTAAERAVVYAPREHRARVISVSNVPFKEMGSGSLCDYSLWARGSTDQDFAQVVERVITMRPSDLILVSHAYLGGTKARWWRTYEAALSRPEVAWRGFDAWVAALQPMDLPMAQVPVNREVKYDAPKPAVPLEQLEDIEGVRGAPGSTAGATGVCQ